MLLKYHRLGRGHIIRGVFVKGDVRIERKADVRGRHPRKVLCS